MTRANPLLSPVFLPRDALPPYVFIIACELDILAGDASRMICALAGKDMGGSTVGREEVGKMGELELDDQKFSFEVRNDGGAYKWLLVPDVVHGYDQRLGEVVRDPLFTEDAELKRIKVQNVIAEWLLTGAFAS